MIHFRKAKLLSLTLIAATVFVFTGCGSSNASADSSTFQKMETVDIDGSTVDASIFADNKLTLLNTWNLGCSACIMEMPILGQLNNDLAAQGVAIKGLYYNFGEEVSDADRAEIKKVMEDAKADFQQILVSGAMAQSDTFKELSVFPMTYFIDSEGNVINSVAGSDDYDGWMEKIEKALKKVESNE